MVEQWKARCAELRWFLFVSNFSICATSIFYFLPLIATRCCSVAQCMVEHISLVGNFGAHPLKTQIAKTLARLPLLHFCTKFSLKISGEDHQKHLYARDRTKVYPLCHLFTTPLPASLSTTFDQNNCRLIML